MKLLIHICCGPCLGGPLEALRAEGFEVEGLFFNPNIHPLLEFRKRVKALKVYLESDPLPTRIEEDYGLESYLRQVRPVDPGRCARCYAMRMERTARTAVDRGVPSFTTTLLVSSHQDHDAVRRAGEMAQEATGARFVYRDFRPLLERSTEIAKHRRLYRQAYCGCVFSEAERYQNTSRELYRGPGGPPQGPGQTTPLG